MKEETLVRGKSPLQELSPLEALELLDEHEFQFVAWKIDRSGVYAMAHSEKELLEKLADLGVAPEQARIKQIGGDDATFCFGLRSV